MAVGRNYELKARFSAEVDGSVDKHFKSMHARLNNLEAKIQKVDKEDVNIKFEERGAAELEARLAKIEKKLETVNRKKTEPRIGVKDDEFYAKVKKVEVRVQALSRKTYEMKIGARTEEARQEVNALQREVRAVTSRIYDLKVKGDMQGIEKGMAELEALEHKISDINGEVIRVRTDFDTGGISRFSLALSGALKNFTSFDRYIQNVSRWGQVIQNFGQLATAAFIGLAAAASGPLLSGLTIAASAAFSVVGGFGLIALAAAPIIKYFSEQEQRATELKAAQDSLKSSTDALKSAQDGLADAQRGVAEAHRTGQEQIQSAIQAHQDAVRGVTEAERSSAEAIKSALQAEADAHRAVGDARREAAEGVQAANDAYAEALQGVADAQQGVQDAHEAARDAAEDVADATQDYNDALATEQSRLQSMRLDIDGMKLSQKQLTLEIRSARREIEQAENPRERREAELRLQELYLQRKQNILDIKDAQRELNNAEKEGTDELQGAADARKDALDAQKDAQKGVADALDTLVDSQADAIQAEKDIAAARRDGQRAIRDALRAERQAQQETAQARREGQQQIAEAMRAEREAQKGIAKARDDAARSMQDAMRAVAEAQEEVAEAARKVKEDQSAVNNLLAKTPRYMKPLVAAVNHFKDQYNKSFEDANQQTAKFGAKLVNTATRFLPMLGQAAFRTVRRVQAAFTQLGREGFKFGALESFRRILRSIPGITATWTKAFGRFGMAFTNIMGQAVPYVRRFSRWVAEIALKFLKWTDSKKGRQQIHKFFEAAAPLAKDLWKWATRIGGAILHWSINHPKELARVLDMVGTAIFFAVRMGMRLMNALFRISKTEHRWRNLALAIIGVRLAFFAVGLALRGLVVAITKGAIVLVRIFKQTATRIAHPMIHARQAITRAWAVLPKNFRQIGSFLIGAARLTVRGMLKSFMALARVSIVGWYIVEVFGQAYNELRANTANTAIGLGRMWQKGQINIGQLILNSWRQIMASQIRIVLKAFIAMARGALKVARWLVNQLGKLFGGVKLGDMLFDYSINQFKKDESMVDKLANMIRGKTNKMAEDMAKNSKKGADSMLKNFGAANKGANKDMNKIASGTKQSMIDAKLAIVNNTNEAKNKGLKHTGGFKSGAIKDFWDTNDGGIKSMKDLNKGVSFNMGDMSDKGLGSTGDLKMGGLKDFGDFNKGGTGSSEELKVAAMKRMWDMQNSVNKATHSTMEKGVADLVDMQERGTGAMSDAQENWVSRAWDTSTQTQQAFNAILEGLGRFIDKAGIDMKKPEQFSVIYRQGGDISGNGNQGMNGANGQIGRQATGNILKYAAGGSHGPVGGVAEGTTRVYGEVPGTTEFYITDNKKYRNRNMEILQAANQHMNFAQGGEVIHDERTGVYRQNGVDYEAAAINPGGINLMRGDHVLGMHGPLSGRARQASKGWSAPSTFGNGRDARVFWKSGVGAGRTGSNGTISVDPQFRGSPILKAILQHEMGHAGGLGHSSRGIMTPSVGPRSSISSAEKKWWHRTHETAVRGGGRGGRGSGGGSGGGNDGGDSDRLTPQEKRQLQREEKEKTAKERRQARKQARRFRKRFNSNRNNYGPLGQPGDYSRNAAWMARGGVLKNLNRAPNSDKQVDENFKMIARAHGSHGPEHEDLPAKKNGVYYEYLGATTHNWGEPAQSIQEATKKAVSGITTNTYVGHPGGEGNSVDHWGPGGRGANIGTSKGNKVESYILANHKKDMEYYIWQGKITGWGRTRPYNDRSDMHFDHLHATYPGGSPNLGGASGGGGSSGPSAEEIEGWWSDSVPEMPDGSKLGYGILGAAASAAGQKVYDAAKEFYISKVPTGSGSSGGTPNGNSPPGLTISDAVKQGGFSDAQHDNAVGVAWEESGGNAGNNINRYRGLFAMGPEAFQEVGMDYNKWNDPIYNANAAMKLQKMMGWAQPWDAWPVSADSKRRGNTKITGYSHGGVVNKAHIGMIGENGPEVNLPLDDPRALAMLTRAFDMSSRVTSGGMQRATQKAMQRNKTQQGDELRGSGVVNGMNVNSIDDKIERAVDKMRESMEDRIERLMEKNGELSAQQAKQMVQWGMEMMRDMMEHPRIGGDINENHMVERMTFRKDLTKK